MAYHRQQGVDTAIVADLQHVRAAHARERRAGDPDVPPPGARRASRVTVFGDGSQTRSFCYVDDLIRGHRPARRVGRAPAGQPRQPGREDAPRARRDRHPRSRARRARSSSRRCRSTIRRCGSRTSRAPRSSSAGSPRSSSRRACGGRSPRSATRPPSARPERRASSLGERYEEHHRERRDEGDFVFVPERIPLFQAAIGRGKRVLDLGCRSGALTRHFLEGNEVVGLDVDRAALAKAADARHRAGAGERRGAASVRGRELRRGRRRGALRAPAVPRGARRRGAARSPSGRRARRLGSERLPGAGPAALPARPAAGGRSRRICTCSRRPRCASSSRGFEDVPLDLRRRPVPPAARAPVRARPRVQRPQAAVKRRAASPAVSRPYEPSPRPKAARRATSSSSTMWPSRST